MGRGFPPWAARAGAIAAATVVMGILARGGGTWRSQASPGDGWGLMFGWTATAALAIGSLYPLRRRVFAWPLGTARRWHQIHVQSGWLLLVLVFLHNGIRSPAGRLGWWLLILTLVTAASGAIGMLLQKFLPRIIARGDHRQVAYEHAPALVARLCEQADSVAAGGSDALTRCYESRLRPMLSGLTPSWTALTDAGSARTRALEPLRAVAPFVPGSDRDRLNRLEAVLSEKLEIDAMYTVQRLLRYWTFFHFPPAAMLLALVAVHLFAVWYF